MCLLSIYSPKQSFTYFEIGVTMVANRKQKRKRFATPEFVEHHILDENGNMFGKVRIKPSTISWKRKGGQKYYNVPIESFKAWIEGSDAKARMTIK